MNRSSSPVRGNSGTSAAFLAFLLTLVLVGCKPAGKSGSSAASGGPTPKNTVEVVFHYSSEKEDWIQQMTKEFNSSGQKLSGGESILVMPTPMGSGDCVDGIMSGTAQPHLISPAASVFLKLAEAESKAKSGQALLKGEPETLVLSPVVIAMWKPMATALGWPQKSLGWSDIHGLATSPQGWAAHGMPQWGAFRFGHTHPEYSNSGLISVLAEIYAAAEKTSPLTAADIAQPKVAEKLAAIERAVVHYGASTGFFGKKLFQGGPGYLSAAVLYENMVINSKQEPNLQMPVVAIYPKEGTFWSDHPAGVVNRPWVGEKQEAAARQYLHWLMEEPQQKAALTLGFRPGNVNIPVTSPVDTAHGVDAAEPKTTLPTPEPEVVRAALNLWKEQKKASHVNLVLDCSGSMTEENRITFAREGALEIVRLLGDRDRVDLLPFTDKVPNINFPDLPLKDTRQKINNAIGGLYAEGGTALYDAIFAAYESAKAHATRDRISAIVVLSDGDDQHSRMNLTTLLSKIRSQPETPGLRVFTIAYGSGARQDYLDKIAQATQARSYVGNTGNIRQIFREISTFF